jgi:hypothetical protein
MICIKFISLKSSIEYAAMADRIHIHRLGRRACVIRPTSHSMSDAVAIMTGAMRPPDDAQAAQLVTPSAWMPPGTAHYKVKRQGDRRHLTRGICAVRPITAGLVGVAGFEPATPSSRTRCATRLRYTPKTRAGETRLIPGAPAHRKRIGAPHRVRNIGSRHRGELRRLDDATMVRVAGRSGFGRGAGIWWGVAKR